MRRVRFIPLVIGSLIGGLFAASALPAQWQATADAGLSRLRQPGIPEANALTLGGGLDFAGDGAALSSSLLGTRTAADRWTVQGVGAGSLIGAPRGAVRLELDGLLSLFAASHDVATVSSEAMARVRLGDNAMGAALGAGGGSFSHAGATAPLVHVQADLWRALRDNELLAGGSVVATQAVGEPLSYADLSGGWRREFRAASVGATGGMRLGIHAVARSASWASADATVWVTPHAALVLGAGRTLEDIVRGVPRTTFASIALRLAMAPHAALGARRPRAEGAEVVVTGSATGPRRIEVRGVRASRVEVMADFTNWNAISLSQDRDRWVVDRLIPPGLHRIAIRIDGGEWVSPANLPHATDDLGGTVGLITVP